MVCLSGKICQAEFGVKQRERETHAANSEGKERLGGKLKGGGKEGKRSGVEQNDKNCMLPK